MLDGVSYHTSFLRGMPRAGELITRGQNQMNGGCGIWHCISLLGLSSANTTDWVAQMTEVYFLIVLEAGSLKIKVPQGWHPLRSLSLNFRWLPFLCVLTWSFFCIHIPGVFSVYPIYSSYKVTSKIGLDPPILVHLTLIASLKNLSPNIVSHMLMFWGLGLQYMNLGEGTLFSL